MVLKGENIAKNGASRAVAMSGLIGEFCKSLHPEAFVSGTTSDLAEIDQMIEELKEDDLHTGLLSGLSENKATLFKVYERLVERHKIYASDEMIAGEVAHFIEEEIHHKAEANMLIVSVQGDENAFVPAQNMATAIVGILQKNGECSPDELKAKGFSQEEIKLHWRMAYALAKVELNGMDA